MKCLLKGRIRCIFRVFSGHFYCMRGLSLVELTADDNSATSTVALIECGHHVYIAEYGTTPGEVAYSARGQLNRKT